MSSGRGRSPCDTGPRELRLDVICPGTLAAASRRNDGSSPHQSWGGRPGGLDSSVDRFGVRCRLRAGAPNSRAPVCSGLAPARKAATTRWRVGPVTGGTVLAHRRAGIGVAGCFLHVSQGHTGIEHGGDERMPQGVGPDPLLDPSISSDPTHDPSPQRAGPTGAQRPPTKIGPSTRSPMASRSLRAVGCERHRAALPPLRTTVRVRWHSSQCFDHEHGAQGAVACGRLPGARSGDVAGVPPPQRLEREGGGAVTVVPRGVEARAPSRRASSMRSGAGLSGRGQTSSGGARVSRRCARESEQRE